MTDILATIAAAPSGTLRTAAFLALVAAMAIPFAVSCLHDMPAR